MRLREIEKELGAAIGKLKFQTTQMSGQNVKISGFHRVIDAATTISQTGVLTSESKTILGFEEISKHIHNEIVIPNQISNEFANAVNLLRQRAELVREVLQSILPAETPDQIAVGLPDDKDLDTVAKDLGEVQVALGQAVINPYVGGQIRLLSFDRGSNWIELALGAPLAVATVGRLLHLILDVASRRIDLDTKREFLRNLRVQNELVEAAERQFEAELDSYSTDGIEGIASAVEADPSDQEYRTRLKVSMKMLADLVQRGLQIQPALVAPTEIQSTFPNPKELLASVRYLPGQKKEIESAEDSEKENS